jgi:hypothetical protein
MKTLTLILSLVISSVALAQEPAELERLRHLWEQSVAKEVDEKNKIYLKSLEKLQKKFMEAKNLAAAVAVDNEIKMVRVLKPAQQRKSLLDGVWIANGKGKNYTFVFNGGRMIDHEGLLATVKYEKGLITVDWDNAPWKHKIKPSPDDPNVMTGTNTYNTMFKYTRVSW